MSQSTCCRMKAASNHAGHASDNWHECEALVQDLLHGSHTAARSDTSLTSLLVSPPAEGRKAGKAAARQTGLSTFYKSAYQSC